MRISDWSSDVCSSDLQLKHKATELVSIAMDTTASGEMREDALNTLVKMDLVTRIRTVIDADDAGSLIMAVLLREADDERIFKELQRIILNEKYSEDLRREAINSLGAPWPGSEQLMKLAETDLLQSSSATLARDRPHSAG